MFEHAGWEEGTSERRTKITQRFYRTNGWQNRGGGLKRCRQQRPRHRFSWECMSNYGCTISTLTGYSASELGTRCTCHISTDDRWD